MSPTHDSREKGELKMATSSSKSPPPTGVDSIRKATILDRIKGFFASTNLGNILVLGGLGVGKTTFWDAFQNHARRDKAEPTDLLGEKGERILFKQGDATLQARMAQDISGSARAVDDKWQGAFRSADVVIYFFRVPFLLGSVSVSALPQDPLEAFQTEAVEVTDHLTLLAHWQEKRPRSFFRKKVPRLIVVGSWCDLLAPGDGWPDREEDIASRVHAHRAISSGMSRLRVQEVQPDLVLGSVAAERDARHLVERIQQRLVP